jgi:hypothetical protein
LLNEIPFDKLVDEKVVESGLDNVIVSKFGSELHISNPV